MPVQIQGNWTVKLISNPIDQPQRFIISNASFGNGTYSDSYTTPIQVQGQNWTINAQEEGSWSGQPGVWISSINYQKTPVQIVNGQYVFQIQFDDYRGGVNYDDLVLQLSQPVPLPDQPEPPSSPPEIPIPPVTPLPPRLPDPTPTPPPVLVPGRVYTKFTIGDKLPRQKDEVLYGMWLDYTGSACGNLTTFFTCSSDTGSFKKTIYSAQCFTCSTTPQFDISYGHDGGSGSRDLGGNDFYTPSNAIYGKYRGLCLDSPKQRFNIGNKEIYHFYALDVKRDRMGDKLDEGNFEINLHHLSGSQFLAGGGSVNTHTGSNVSLGSTTALRLIDDSGLDFSLLTDNAKSTFYRDISSSLCPISTGAGKVHYIVSGTLETGIYNSTQPHVYGLLYPNQGIIILDAELLDLSASFLTTTGSDVAGDNAMKMFRSISGSALLTDDSGDYLGLKSRKLKYEYVEQFFVRVKNTEYNFTNNKTYQSGSEGVIIDDFYDKPQTYISEIGLFNDNHELLAIAKPSSPIYKKYTEEALIEVILKY